MFKKTFSFTTSLALLFAPVWLLPQAATAAEETIEEVVVTGSRIKQANLVTNSPVVQLDSDEMMWQGNVRVEDMMRNLPQVYSSQNTTQSNGGTGTATIDLRNLGQERTLVLVNGRRMPAGSPLQGGIGPDINQIPGAMIDRVEILTGGASAAYGSDAVAGVVNFILRDDFQGVSFDAQFSQYQHDNDNKDMRAIVEDAGFPVPTGSKRDGDMSTFSFVMGGDLDGGRGNITAYATYRDIDPVDQSRRDYSACSLNAAADTCRGSGTIPDGRVTNFDDMDFKVEGTNFVPRGGTVFNFGPLNYFQRPDERYSLGAVGHYEINDNIEAYTELMFMDDRTVTQIAPSGAFFITDTIPCGNPLLSAQQFDQLCGQFGLDEDDVQDAFLGRRNVEGGNRRQDLRHTSYRFVFGLRGDLDENWSYDVSGQYSEVSMENTYMNDLGITKITRALDAVTSPDEASTAGSTVCRSTVNGPDSNNPEQGASDPNCIPWDIFTTGAVTQDQLDYLVLPLFARGTTDQTVVTGYVNGYLGDYGVQLPWADQGVALVLGLEYREENLDFNPDEGFRLGEGAGQGGATGPVNGGYDVSEFFLEAQIPLVQGKAWAEDLSLDLAYRYSDYSTGIDTNTYGIRAGWAINNSFKIRASHQRAIRAANVQELFLPQGFNLFDMDEDPCGTSSTRPTPARSPADCANSGIGAFYGDNLDSPAGQYNFLQGGNPDLEPEESDTYSIGVVWTPGYVDGLSVSLDYYDIEITQGINNLNPDFILNECLDGDQSQCAKVNRNTSRGDLWIGSDTSSSGHVVALQDNLAIERVKGFDVLADYTWEAGKYGSMALSDNMGIIDTWNQQELAGAPVESCKGIWGGTCGYPTPEFQNNLRYTWITPWNVTASVMWRYISGIDDFTNNEVDLDAVNYFDLAGTWDITGNIQARLGVTNIFDEEPPIAGANAGSASQGNGNIYPGMYDFLGRYWFIGVKFGT